MKKLHFFILAIALCLASAAVQASNSLLRDKEAFTVAKAIKLGREKMAIGKNSIVLPPPRGEDELDLKDCDANCAEGSCNRITGKCSKCISGRWLDKNLCWACPTYATCNGLDFTCRTKYRKQSDRCVANCAGVSCKSGFVAVANSTGCCCSCPSGQIYNTTIKKCVSATCPIGCTSSCANGCSACESGRYLDYSNGSCPTCTSKIANCARCSSSAAGVTCTACASGYRLSNGSCVANCTNVSCKSGFVATSTSTGCCCSCPDGQIYNTTIKKCVAAVCPIGCKDSCTNGCGSCESGRYLDYSNGSCPTCSSKIRNCATCSSSAAGVKCTACAYGYRVSNGTCVANCTGVSCKSGYTATSTSTGCCCKK